MASVTPLKTCSVLRHLGAVRPLVVLAVVAALAWWPAGCSVGQGVAGAGPGSGPTGEVGAPPTARGASVLAAPIAPEALEDRGEPGAIAAAQHFFAEQRYAYRSGEVDGLRSLAASACLRCSDTVAAIEEIHRQGMVVSWGEPLSNDEADGVAHDEGTWLVGIWEITGGLRVVEASGDVFVEYPAGAQKDLWVVVGHDGDKWLVHDYGAL